VLRLLPDGNLDPTFGDDGLVLTEFTGTWNGGHSMAVTSDGRVVVGGPLSDPRRFFVARYTADGALDPTFGTAAPGLTTANMFGADDIWAVAVLPNGDILSAGQRSGRAIVLRYRGEAGGAAATVNKQAPFVLNLGVTDPGNDSVSQYEIRWGDSQEFIPASEVSATGQIQHVYNVPGVYRIHVDVQDEHGWHRDAGLLDVLVRDAGPNLKVKQTVKPASARPRKTVTFRINVANIGNWQAGGVFLTFQLPAGLKRIAAGNTPGWTGAGKQRFRFNLNTLAAGQSVTLTFKARLAATLRPGSVLTAKVSAGLGGLEGPDANLGDNLHKVKIRVLS